MREDLDDDEYEEGKTDTLKQMEEFEQSLSKMMVFITFMSGEPNVNWRNLIVHMIIILCRQAIWP